MVCIVRTVMFIMDESQTLHGTYEKNSGDLNMKSLQNSYLHTLLEKNLKNFDECNKVLGAMVKFRCKKGCRAGGGSPFCNIRKCCQKKDLEGCQICERFETCEKLDFLKPVHGDAYMKNLRVIKKRGKKEFVKGKTLWYNPTKTK